ncbi:MAG: hypothetical protein ACXAEF_05895, partial [Candidatus Thorarchaeota archaeon]
MESSAPEQTELLEEQRNILRIMRRSHRFLMGHILSTVFGIYIVMFWVVLLVAIMGLPLQLLSIASVIILLPIAIAPLQYRSAKERFGTLQEAGAALKEIENSLNTSHIVTGLTSYIFLIFDVLRPEESLDTTTSYNEVEELRGHLNNLTRRVIVEVIFHGALYTILIFNFLIPE